MSYNLSSVLWRYEKDKFILVAFVLCWSEVAIIDVTNFECLAHYRFSLFICYLASQTYDNLVALTESSSVFSLVLSGTCLFYYFSSLFDCCSYLLVVPATFIKTHGKHVYMCPCTKYVYELPELCVVLSQIKTHVKSVMVHIYAFYFI